MSKLKELREAKDLTQGELAELAKTSQPQIRRLEIGERKLTKEWAERLAPHLGVTAEALLFPTKPIVSSFDPDAPDAPNAEDVGLFYPPDAVKELAAQAGLGAGQVIETTYKREGEEHVATDAVRDDYWRLPPWYVRDMLGARVSDLLIVEGRGDSMTPTIQTGDRAVVNTAQKTPSPDGLYAIRNAFDEVVVKRLQSIGFNPPRIRIISDNPAHVAQEVSMDEIAIVGQVVLLIKQV